MRIILSPAKKMNEETDSLAPEGMPVYLEQTAGILAWLCEQPHENLQKLWKCNDKIAEQNFRRLEHMNLYERLTPAILSYEGIAYQYMAPAVFEEEQLVYVQKNLRILSAFYGVLKPMDGVTPYRLEMQAKASINGYKDLYALWGRRLYEEAKDDSGVIINLASKEYSKCIEKYLTDTDHYITVVFCEKSGERLVTKGTYAKMARGEMVRYMAENKIENPEEIRSFDRLGYVFRDDLSSDTEYIFERI
ncbi:MAG: peroxide stress protein YaaA [Blautia sp.]|nr:peroxide stress protein YaaA [Blautia sp.]MDY3999931.1 peroxide stress protein YaaA [Blautia sp.]